MCYQLFIILFTILLAYSGTAVGTPMKTYDMFQIYIFKTETDSKILIVMREKP